MSEGEVDGPGDLTFINDKAERLARIRETAGGTFTACGAAGPRCLKEYTFGTFNSGSDLRLGKVQVAKRYNYLPAGPAPNTMTIAETYTYAGKDGRASKRDTQVFADTIAREAFTQSFTYDDLGNTASLAYPQCTHTGCAPGAASPKTVTFAYTEGLLTAVPGYASAITYYSNQTISQVVHSNGISDVIGIDPNAQQRPGSILAKNAREEQNGPGMFYDTAGNHTANSGAIHEYDLVFLWKVLF